MGFMAAAPSARRALSASIIGGNGRAIYPIIAMKSPFPLPLSRSAGEG
jgi:hypothetical protein